MRAAAVLLLALMAVSAYADSLIGPVTLDLDEYFYDPDGDALTYDVRASPPAIVDISLTGPILTIRAIGVGVATISVRACDPFECSVWDSFTVTVKAPSRPRPPPPLGPGAPHPPEDSPACESGLPFVSLVRLEWVDTSNLGPVLIPWVRVDRAVEHRVIGGVIITGSAATGPQQNAFSFRPGEPREKSAAFHRPDPADHSVTVWVNPVFRDAYCADATRMLSRVPR